MDRRTFLAGAALASVPPPAGGEDKPPAASDWPWWRGPTRDGLAPDQKVPLEWSLDKNVRWAADVPGRGHGSACVAGPRVFLAAAEPDGEVQSVLCFDRATGKRLWQAPVHKGNFAKGGNGKSSHASATPACDGERVYINFLNAGAVHATALDLDGKIVWRTKVADYVLHQGFGASPAVAAGLVLVSADNKGGGVLAGLDPATGKVAWARDRPKAPNYASPILVAAGGKERLVLTGCDLVTCLDPRTGKEQWEVKGATTECVTSTVTDGVHLFTSGGYPKNHVAAYKLDGSGLAWENKARVYVPSMLVRGGHLFAVMDEGNAVCWKADTGAELWKGRLGGTFSASLVGVGDHAFATNEAGRTFVFKLGAKELEVVAENRLGDETFATPAVAGGCLFVRTAVKADSRRLERLYCLGSPG